MEGDAVKETDFTPSQYDLTSFTSHNVTMKGDVVKETDFAYIHIPSPHHENVSNSDSSDGVITNHDVTVANENDRKLDPKPPKVGKRPVSASFRRPTINRASPTSSNPKRPKTPERHIVGVREHHQRDRVARQQSPDRHKRRESSSPLRGTKMEERTGRSSSRPDSAQVSVVMSSFQRGISPEPSKVKGQSVPSLKLDNEDDDTLNNEHDSEIEDMLDEFGGLDAADDNESVLMQKIADFRPQLAGVGQMNASGDAPTVDQKWYPQVSFDLPHQSEIDNLLDRPSESRKGGVPGARPSSAGPQRSIAHPNKARPSSAKSKVSQYLIGNTQYKRKWATSSSLWGSRSFNSSAGDLQVAGQRSKMSDVSKSPNLVRKSRPESAKMMGSGDGETGSGSNFRGQRSRPWSAGVSRNKDKDSFLRVGASQLQGKLRFFMVKF